MSNSRIARAMASAKAYLAAHPEDARYRGSAASAPSPGWLFRAAYASCAATLIAMRVAEQVVLTALEVEVDSESDDRGILGIAEDVPAGPISMKVAVRAESAQDEGAVREVITWGLNHCPVDDAVRRSIPVEIDVRVAGG